LPSERHKTLTGLVNTEPMVGAQLPRAQKLQWFLSESNWDERKVQAERLTLLREDPSTAPTSDGVLVIDETEDRKDGHHTAHVGRHYLANLGKIDNGVVSVTSLWADERVYYPVDVEPYTPAHHFEKGKKDPQFRTKRQRSPWSWCAGRCKPIFRFGRWWRTRSMARIAVSSRGCEPWEWAMCWPSNPRMRGGIRSERSARSRRPRRRPAGRVPSDLAAFVKVTRTFRDGSSQDGWALEVITGPYGPHKQERVVIATTDPVTLPDLTTFYLVTNLPEPGTPRAADSELAAASLQEVVRLYGLRMWVEQSYKQVKHALGWSQYQVRSDRAMRRHWQLVCCAFSFCWYHASHATASTMQEAREPSKPEVSPQQSVPASTPGTGEKNQRGKRDAATAVLAEGAAGGARMVGALDHAQALLERLVATAPPTSIATPAELA
jgi:hypothetical protein